MSKGQMNEVEQMKKCLVVLSRTEGRVRGMGEGDEGCAGGRGEGDEEEEEEDEREAALELLSELCENLDNARGENVHRHLPKGNQNTVYN